MYSFKLIGDWDKVTKLLKALPNEVKSISISTQRSIAESYARKIKNHILSQDIPGWTPLDPRYADRKMGEFGREEMLMRSLDYYQSIKAWRENNTYLAGVPQGLHYENGIEIARVARIHEDWAMTPGRPHRPLWIYTFEKDLGGTNGLKKLATNLMKKKLQAKGYPIT